MTMNVVTMKVTMFHHDLRQLEQRNNFE